MFQSKSFDLVNEENAKKQEKLYEPKRCRWLKYIIIPALIGFMLLLILTNVDFSSNVDDLSPSTPSSTDTTSEAYSEVLTTSIPLESVTSAKYHLNPQVRATGCYDSTTDPCQYQCIDSNLSNLNKNLDTQQKWCDGVLHVTLLNCWFPSGNLKADFFSGSFRLGSFIVINSDLTIITQGAFKKSTVTQTLKTLVFNGTKFVTLNDKTFEGLTAVKEFVLLNLQGYNKFSGTKFLKPMAASLEQVSLEQKTTSNVYDPKVWLDDASFSKLRQVDLSHNNFADVLNSQTFNNLLVVEELMLANCAISSFGLNTFDGISSTLRYLDLSSNSLNTLGPDFLAQFPVESGLQLELYGNAWNCSCEFVANLKTANISSNMEATCATPEKWQGMSIREVNLDCQNGGVRTTMVITESTESTTIRDTTRERDTTETTLTTEKSTNQTTSVTRETEESTRWTDKDTTNISTMDTTVAKDTTKTTLTTESSTSSASSETEEGTSETEEGTSETEEDTSETNESTSETEEESTSTQRPPLVNPTYVICKHNTEANNITIRNYDALFGIFHDTSNSVVLMVQGDMQNLKLAHFTQKDNIANITTRSASPQCRGSCYKLQRATVTTTMIHIKELSSNQTYLFCLVPDAALTISPFNCRAHFLQEDRKMSAIWLNTNDMAWCITLLILGILLLIVLGILTIYWLLRWRPSWLYGSERIIKGARKHEDYLIPKLANNTDSACSSNSMDSHLQLNLDPKSYDYMQFYKDMHGTNKEHTQLYISNNVAPNEPAPTLPPIAPSRPASLQSTIPADDLRHHQHDDDNEYQSIDYYMELF